MNYTKKDISNALSRSSSITKIESHLFVDIFLNLLKEESKNKIIKISNFGTFMYKSSPKRIGRNPKTKKEYVIHPAKKLTFIPSIRLKKFIN